MAFKDLIKGITGALAKVSTASPAEGEAGELGYTRPSPLEQIGRAAEYLQAGFGGHEGWVVGTEPPDKLASEKIADVRKTHAAEDYQRAIKETTMAKQLMDKKAADWGKKVQRYNIMKNAFDTIEEGIRKRASVLNRDDPEEAEKLAQYRKELDRLQTYRSQATEQLGVDMPDNLTAHGLLTQRDIAESEAESKLLQNKLYLEQVTSDPNIHPIEKLSLLGLAGIKGVAPTPDITYRRDPESGQNVKVTTYMDPWTGKKKVVEEIVPPKEIKIGPHGTLYGPGYAPGVKVSKKDYDLLIPKGTKGVDSDYIKNSNTVMKNAMAEADEYIDTFWGQATENNLLGLKGEVTQDQLRATKLVKTLQYLDSYMLDPQAKAYFVGTTLRQLQALDRVVALIPQTRPDGTVEEVPMVIGKGGPDKNVKSVLDWIEKEASEIVEFGAAASKQEAVNMALERLLRHVSAWTSAAQKEASLLARHPEQGTETKKTEEPAPKATPQPRTRPDFIGRPTYRLR